MLLTDRVVVTNEEGKITALSSITTTELGYLNGTTSNIQNQIDNVSKASTYATNAGTAVYSKSSAKASSATSATYSSTANYAKNVPSSTQTAITNNSNNIATYLLSGVTAQLGTKSGNGYWEDINVSGNTDFWCNYYEFGIFVYVYFTIKVKTTFTLSADTNIIVSLPVSSNVFEGDGRNITTGEYVGLIIKSNSPNLAIHNYGTKNKTFTAGDVIKGGIWYRRNTI